MNTDGRARASALLVVEAPGFHGASLRALSIGRELQNLGRRVVVAVPRGNDAYTQALQSAGLEVLLLGFRRFRKALDPVAFVRSALSFGPALWTLARYIRRNRITSVHSFELHNVLGPIAGRLAGARVVWYLGNLTGYGVLGKPLRGLVDQLADQVISVCRAVSEAQFPSRLGRDARFAILPTFVDLEEFRPEIDVSAVGRELDRRPGEVWICQVGGLYPVKGLEYFVRAAALVHKRASRPVRFVHVGPAMDLHEAYHAEIRRLIQALGLERQFRILGTRKTVWDVISLCDILVNASLTEGLPTVVLEAMACARPVVATNVGGVPECVADGETGVLVPACDVEALAAAILRLVEDRELSMRMGRAGRARAEALVGPDALRVGLRALL